MNTLKELHQEANNLIREGNSSQKSQGLGMLKVLNSFTKNWYDKIKDIPFGNV
jgi:hypothetical protein